MSTCYIALIGDKCDALQKKDITMSQIPKHWIVNVDKEFAIASTSVTYPFSSIFTEWATLSVLSN
jgi:hypothetical protein